MYYVKGIADNDKEYIVEETQKSQEMRPENKEE
jgi:hypothetical protein